MAVKGIGGGYACLAADLTVQVKSALAADDPVFRGASLYLK